MLFIMHTLRILAGVVTVWIMQGFFALIFFLFLPNHAEFKPLYLPSELGVFNQEWPLHPSFEVAIGMALLAFIFGFFSVNSRPTSASDQQLI